MRLRVEELFISRRGGRLRFLLLSQMSHSPSLTGRRRRRAPLLALPRLSCFKSTLVLHVSPPVILQLS